MIKCEYAIIKQLSHSSIYIFFVQPENYNIVSVYLVLVVVVVFTEKPIITHIQWQFPYIRPIKSFGRNVVDSFESGAWANKKKQNFFDVFRNGLRHEAIAYNLFNVHNVHVQLTRTRNVSLQNVHTHTPHR